MTYNLDANAIGRAEYQRTYRARGWKFPRDTCDDLLATAIATVQEVLRTYEGRGTISLRGKRVVNTKQQLMAEACRQAHNAMRRLADGKKASTLSLGSGYRAEEGQSEGGTTDTLPSVDKTPVDRPATEFHDAVQQSGVALGEYANADKHWRYWIYRAVKERAYARLTPAQQRHVDMHPTTAQERALKAEACEMLRRNEEEARQETDANERFAEAAVSYAADPGLVRFREKICLWLEISFPKARSNPATIAMWRELFGINIQRWPL